MQKKNTNKIKNIVIILIGLCITSSVLAQADLSIAKKYKDEISIKYLKSCLYDLASPTFEGRGTADRGQKLAAAYIQYEFKNMGLTPSVQNENCSICEKSYFMPFFVREEKLNKAIIKINSKTEFTAKNDFIAFLNKSSKENEKLSFVFAGNGDNKILDNINIKNKAVVVYYDGKRRTQSSVIAKKIMKKGARLLIEIDKNEKNDFENYHKYMSPYAHNSKMSIYKELDNSYLGNLLMSKKTANKILGKSEKDILSTLDKYEKDKNVDAIKKIKPATHIINFSLVTRKRKTENVLGYLEGTDLKDELIVLTAHYDHLGRDGEKIYYGADDDGSGTSTILAIAKAFTKAKQNGNGPRRSILFMTVTGEEKGLLGSEWYADNPIYPLKQTVANLNIDMIGRIDPKHKNGKDYVYLVGSDKLSDELHKISENANKKTVNMELDYTYNDESHPSRIYYRSDHWNFAKNNIPVIFYFNGIHNDYHKITDTPDKINFELLKKRAELVYYTAWQLVNKDKRLKMNK